MFLFFALLIIAGGIIGANAWYDMDKNKCEDISDNSYYYSDNNCWETMNKPFLTKSLMYLFITIIPGLIWLILLIMSKV